MENVGSAADKLESLKTLLGEMNPWSLPTPAVLTVPSC